MDPQIDIEAWERDGKTLWETIQRDKLVVIWWNNPWLRLAMVGSVLLAGSLVTYLVWRAIYLALPLALLASPFIFGAIKYWMIGIKTGGLYSFFSEDGFGIGCDADRILIPYDQIEVPEYVSPSTVNENFIALPVVANPQGIRIENKIGNDKEWDGRPYKRGIATIEMRNGDLVACTKPNEMIVHLFCAIYPLSMHLKPRGAEQDAQPDAFGAG